MHVRDNELGIGVTAPSFRLTVGSNLHAAGDGMLVDGIVSLAWGGVSATPAAGNVFLWHESTDGGSLRAKFFNGVTAMTLMNNGNLTIAGTLTQSSSRGVKEEIRDLATDEALAALAELRPRRYRYKVSRGEEQLGFVAEELPSLVATADRRGAKVMDIVAVLTKALQQQRREVEALELRERHAREREQRLEREVAGMRTELESLRRMVVGLAAPRTLDLR